ncbi:MAG: threonylcarbamoyl-AMP synthase [Clostridia bacterium]|nr:threonylcarbamoyl-AMP synthase [Clostridia bacterium]
MRTEYLSSAPSDLQRAADLLKAGELVAIPTETVYGLAADALNGEAVAAIFAAKGRPADNPLIVHIAAVSEWERLVSHIPPQALALAEAFWPGPLTMILPKTDLIPNEVSAGLSTVAVRMPSHPIARELIALSGCPLAAPSANRSGIPSPTEAKRVAEDMDGRIAAVVDGGTCDVGVESTVIDLSTTPPRLLRPGAVTVEMLTAVIGEIAVDDAVVQPLKSGRAAASPGMKYKHYAPKAKVILVKGDKNAFVDYVNAHAADGVAALCFDGEETGLCIPYFTYGARDDHAAQAHHVFEVLRRLDEQHVRIAYTACPSQDGVGLAVYNRLLRAAGFEVIVLE